MEPWYAAPMTCLGLLLGLCCHRRLLAIFPEDQPGQVARKRHARPTPLVGWTLGLAALGLSFGAWWLMAAICLTTWIGYLDDRGKDAGTGSPVGWHRKGRYLAAASVCGAVHLWQQQGAPVADSSVGDAALALLLLFAVTNAANFLDNANGVTAALGSLGLLLATHGQGPMAALGFVYLGFLPLNWPRPIVFLGDSGALTLGLCLGVTILGAGPGAQGSISLATLAPVAVFLLDFVQVVLARLIIGVPPWVGDRRHLTHILSNLGLPHWLLAPLLTAGAWLIVEYLAPHLA